MELDMLEMWIEFMQLYEGKIMKEDPQSYENILYKFIDHVAKNYGFFERLLSCPISPNQE
jgi:hypothetical protein